MGQGTHEGRYALEIDGLTAILASEVTMPSKDHSEVELYVGNQPNPILVRGNFKVTELTFKHATGLNETASELNAWLDDFLDGIDTTRRGGRFIVYSEDGETPLDVYELFECVPKSFKPEGHSASGNNAAMFTFSLRPTNMRRIA